MKQPSENRSSAAMTLWVAALLVAVLLDRPVAAAVRQFGIDAYLHSGQALRWILKAPGEFWPSLIACGLLYMGHRLRHKAAALVLIAACLTGINTPAKWIAGRTRPFKLFDSDHVAQLAPFTLEPFRGGLPGMVRLENLSFPSGHAAWAFATAASLSILLPRWRWAFYTVAVMVGAERVLENGHWLSDVVAAAALGVGSVHLVRRLGWDAWANREEAEQRHGRQALPLAGDPGV
jgi:membrane-associated phospholipid phosphatase